MTDQARELASLLLKAPTREPVGLLQGVVAALESDGRVQVFLSGSPFPVGGIRHLDSYSPREDDVVWMAKSGADVIILGSLENTSPGFDASQPWNTAWGILEDQAIGTTSASYSVSGNTDMVLTDVPVRADRTYKVVINTQVQVTAAAVWALECRVDGTQIGRFALVNEAFFFGESGNGAVLYKPSVDDVVTIRAYAAEVTGTASFSLPAAATVPRQFWIEDIGPRVRI